MEKVTGQIAVKNSLLSLINSGKIPHAFLFSGTVGVGKEFMAIEFAKKVCEKFSSPEELNKTIHAISNFNEPYLKFIFPLPRGKNESEDSGPLEKLSNDEIQTVKDELAKKIVNPYYKLKIPKANNIKVSSIREIKKFTALNYDDIPYRFIVITDAEMMNEPSQNALLKSLEEPPAGVIFILITSNLSRIRETILSRCWHMHFSPLANSDVAKILEEHFECDANLANMVANFSNGSVHEALRLIEHDFTELLNKTVLFLRYSLGRKYHSALKEINSLNDINGIQSIKLLIRLIIYWFNDFEKLRRGYENDFYFTEQYETFSKFYKRYPNIKTTELITNLEKLSELSEQNLNLNIIIINIVFELSNII